MLYYKYVPPERVDVIRNLLIRYTQPTAQNDPFEFRLMGDLIFRDVGYLRVFASDLIRFLRCEGQSLTRAADSLEHALNLSREAADHELDARLGIVAHRAMYTLGNNHGILSMTDDPANPIMWAHYAASHTGFLIGFAPDNLWFKQNRISADDQDDGRIFDLRLIRKVRYVNTNAEGARDLPGRDIFHCKSRLWEYESEWRMLRPLNKHHTKVGKDIFLFRVPPSSIVSVILGVRSSSVLESKINKVIRENENLRHVYVGRAKEDSFKAGIQVPLPQTGKIVVDGIRYWPQRYAG